MRVASGTERSVVPAPPLAWMSRWRRFLTTLASGIIWNQMRGPSPWGSMMLSAPIPSSLSGSPMSRRQSSQVANPSGGGSSTYPRAAAQKRASSSGSLQSMTSWNRAGIVLPSVPGCLGCRQTWSGSDLTTYAEQHRSSAPASPAACGAMNAASVMPAGGMLWLAGYARTWASGHGRPLASPRPRVAHQHDEGVQQQERYYIEEQARDTVRDRRAVASDEIPPVTPGPDRVADAERLAEWHLAAPGDVRAAFGKVALGHHVATAVPGQVVAGLTIRHRVEGVLVPRAERICPRVHFDGQDEHGDTSHRDEHEDDEHPAAMVVRRIAMRVGVQRVMRNAALRAHLNGRVGAVNACCIDDDDNEPGQDQSE